MSRGVRADGRTGAAWAVRGCIGNAEARIVQLQADNRTVRIAGNLGRLENESIHIIREALAEARQPVLLFSGGKDSTVLAALAARAFSPGPPPLPLMHVDSTFEFDETLRFRDAFAERLGYRLIVEANEAGRRDGINPFTHGSALYTDIMRTQALKEALDRHGFDVILGGARRDEEKTRAKERIFSIRSANHGWDPRNQRPELWSLFNARLAKSQSVRVFPLSNWTEADIWTYIAVRNLPIAPLYFSAERPTVEYEGRPSSSTTTAIPIARASGRSRGRSGSGPWAAGR